METYKKLTPPEKKAFMKILKSNIFMCRNKSAHSSFAVVKNLKYYL